jgi:hypothetical protein
MVGIQHAYHELRQLVPWPALADTLDHPIDLCCVRQQGRELA